MIITAIVIGIIIIGLIVLTNYLNSSSYGDMGAGVFFAGLVMIFCVIEANIISDIITEPKPTPMDVYQGKTTLEYTIRDGIKIDSVVVFKENYEKD